MSHIFKDVIGKHVLVYLDDILVFSRSVDEHMEHLRGVLETLRKHKFYAKLSKCEFGAPQVHYLGYVVSGQGIHVDPKKTEVVENWPQPRNTKDVRSFLGLGKLFQAVHAGLQ